MAIIENRENTGDYMQAHAITIDNREKLSISGVSDVETFDENTIILHTVMGMMTICGHNLHIRELNVDTTDLNVEGRIDSIEYHDESMQKSKGFFSGIFR